MSLIWVFPFFFSILFFFLFFRQILLNQSQPFLWIKERVKKGNEESHFLPNISWAPLGTLGRCTCPEKNSSTPGVPTQSVLLQLLKCHVDNLIHVSWLCVDYKAINNKLLKLCLPSTPGLFLRKPILQWTTFLSSLSLPLQKPVLQLTVLKKAHVLK